jgi:hypothetical protein
MTHHEGAGLWGGTYFLGFIGALIYLMQHANSFWGVVGGFFQAIFWPATLIYYVFGFLRI